MNLRKSIVFAFANFIILVDVARADWPQWRGPNRDGHAAPESLLKSWPDQGPELNWRATELGRGYSAVAIVGDRLYTMGSDESACYAYCLELETGKQVWKTEVSRASSGDDYNHGWGGGPRSTPTVDLDQVFVLTDIGVVVSLGKSDGKVQWEVDLVKTHGGKNPHWGYSESPLVDGDRVIVTPGESNFMIGLNRATGEKIWESEGVDSPAQYVSAIKATVGKTSFYVTANKNGLLGLDAMTGRELFSDANTGNGVAVIPTPIVSGSDLYHTSAYKAGNTRLVMNSPAQGTVEVESVYHLTGKTMENHHGGVVLVDGVIYGSSKVDGGVWMAQDLETGKVIWQHKVGRNGSGSIAYADGKLYCYNDEDGTLDLIDASREGWKSTGKLTLPQQTELPRDKGAIWAHPVIANGTLVIRDQDLIYAYAIGDSARGN